MKNLPDDRPAWMEIVDPYELHEVPIHLARDPYFLQDAPTDLLDEDDPYKNDDDEEEDDFEKDEESDDKGILQEP